MRKKLAIYMILMMLLTVLLSGCSILFHRFVFGDETLPPEPGKTTEAHETEQETETATEPAETPAPTEATEPPTEPHSVAPTVEVTEAPTEAPAPQVTFEDRNETVYTTARLNIRTSPSLDGEIIVVAKHGDALKRTGYHDEWSRLEYDGQTAYASSEYLSASAPSFSNEVRNYGFDPVKRDSDNVPRDMDWFIRSYGTYADFLQDRSKNVIYLTIDEGYETGNTPAILDTLKKKNVPAVFFLTKGFVDDHPDLVRRMIDEGHILGNHTCSHPAAGMPSLSVEAQKADIMQLHNQVLDQFGYEMKLFRFPAGIFRLESLHTVSTLGYRSIFWSFAYRDFDLNNQPDPATALKKCTDEVHPGAIYLLHAVSSTNTQIMGDWIDAVRAKGFEFGQYPVR